MWVDAHCHIDFDDFNQDREAVVLKAFTAGVTKIAVPGVSPAQWLLRDQRLQQLRDQMPKEWDTRVQYGLHPYWVSQAQERLGDQLVRVLEGRPGALVGEIGLDFSKGQAAIELQVPCFEQQLLIAKSLARPVILHVRNAHHEIHRILKKLRFTEGGLVHAFAGNEYIAKTYIDYGFKLGVGGAMTYTRATKLRSTLKIIDLEHLLLETDSPDMAPAFLQNSEAGFKRNTPLTIPLIGQSLAQLKAVDINQVATVTTDTAIALFGF
jgi:TatD DNase family protein